MKFNKKGQAALEFLTTYGWAFLAILVMVGALSYFGVFDASKFVPESCKLDGNLECPSYALNSSQLNIRIQNNLMTPIKVTKIRITERGNTSFEDAFTGSSSIPKQSEADITGNGSINLGSFKGEKKTFILNVYYTKGSSTIANVAEGTLTALVRDGPVS